MSCKNSCLCTQKQTTFSFINIFIKIEKVLYISLHITFFKNYHTHPTKVQVYTISFLQSFNTFSSFTCDIFCNTKQLFCLNIFELGIVVSS